MPILTATTEHFKRAQNMHIARLHERKTRSSTKLASNLYGRIENDAGTHADAVYRYYDTDIIRALYEYGTVQEGYNDPKTLQGINILAVEIFTDGWETSVYTKRRISQFLMNNLIQVNAFGYQGNFYVLPYEEAREFYQEDAQALYRRTGVTKFDRWKDKNLFNPDTHTAFIPVSMPMIHTS